MNVSQQILSDIGVYSKYAKFLPNKKRRETYDEIVERNTQMHITKYPEYAAEIRKAYNKVFDKKILPSMRSFQFAGKPIDVNPSRIYNCAYLPIEDWRAFNEIMFLLLGGTGVGYSVQKHHVEKLPEIHKPNTEKTKRYLVGDSIEGWADAIKVLMKSYFKGGPKLRFDFSDIRPKGALLVTSGGKAPGPQPLRECLVKIDGILAGKEEHSQLTPIECHDIVCHIADAVLAGGIRRAALISLFSADDEAMLNAKSGSWWELNPQRGRANNSAVLVRHKLTKSFFMDIWKRVEASNAGEPGIYLTHDKNWGTNPCAEISLRPYQFCNLVEINAGSVENQKDFNERVEAATILATLQASYTDFHYLRAAWKNTTERDALIGIGMTGLASNNLQSIDLQKGVDVAKKVNAEWAKRLGINPAARLTTVKPSGTTSIVLGTSSGVHAWHDDYYIRRMRVGKDEALYKYLVENHPEIIEDEYFRPDTMAVVSIPQKAPEGAILRNEESPIDLLERVKWLHDNWIKPGHVEGANTHNVSATISIKPEEWEEVGEWMWKNRDCYNGLSCLPYDGGTYKQAPFETIDEETYNELIKQLHAIDLAQVIEDRDETTLQYELACVGGACEIF